MFTYTNLKKKGSFKYNVYIWDFNITQNFEYKLKSISQRVAILNACMNSNYTVLHIDILNGRGTTQGSLTKLFLCYEAINMNYASIWEVSYHFYVSRWKKEVHVRNPMLLNFISHHASRACLQQELSGEYQRQFNGLWQIG